LKKRRSATGSALPNNPAASTPDRYIELLGVTTKEFEEAGKDREWLDMHRHGFRSKMKIDLSELMKEKEIVENITSPVSIWRFSRTLLTTIKTQLTNR
jgi:hypothetical protein